MAQPQCSACHAPLKATSKFCSSCGQQLIVHGEAAVSGGKVIGPVVGVNQGTITHIVNQAAKAAVTTLHSTPAPPLDFTGRDTEVIQLAATLRTASANGTAATICGVRGLGGIGKSALAYKVAQTVKDAFPDARIFVPLRGSTEKPMLPDEALRTVLRAFGQESDPQATVDELASIYRSTLAGKRALILADDAKDAQQVKPLQPPAGCALLITSRRWFRLPGMPEPLELGKLAEPDALAFVMELCPRMGNAATQLAQLCGFLPLALRIGATYLAKPTRSIERYLAELGDERTRLRRMRGDDSEADVEASLTLSYKALSEDAQALLRQLGVFVASFSRLAAENVTPLPADVALDDLLDELHTSSLLDYDQKSERWSLHDLIRVFALERLRQTGEEQAVRLRYAAFYKALADYADNLFLQGNEHIAKGLALFDAERPHIDAVWTWLWSQSPAEATDKLLIGFADATVHIGDLRYNKRQERIPQLGAAREAAERQRDRAAEGRFLGNLGIAYAGLGDARTAIQFYEQQLVIVREIEDRQGAGNALGNLGIAYKYLGDARTAIQFYEQALVIAREIEDRRGAGNALGNLGNAYVALGDARKAIELYKQALVIAREIGDRQGEGADLGNLGLAYAELGDARKAIELYERALVIAREIEDRQGEGANLSNLGNAYAELGDARKAIELYEQALVIAREIGDRRDEGNALGNLGLVYASLGELERALAYAQQAYSSFVAIESPYVKHAQAQVERLKRLLAGKNTDKQLSHKLTVLLSWLRRQTK